LIFTAIATSAYKVLCQTFRKTGMDYVLSNK
jgi:hypothetical protein